MTHQIHVDYIRLNMSELYIDRKNKNENIYIFS